MRGSSVPAVIMAPLPVSGQQLVRLLSTTVCTKVVTDWLDARMLLILLSPKNTDAVPFLEQAEAWTENMPCCQHIGSKDRSSKRIGQRVGSQRADVLNWAERP